MPSLLALLCKIVFYLGLTLGLFLRNHRILHLPVYLLSMTSRIILKTIVSMRNVTLRDVARIVSIGHSSSIDQASTVRCCRVKGSVDCSLAIWLPRILRHQALTNSFHFSLLRLTYFWPVHLFNKSRIVLLLVDMSFCLNLLLFFFIFLSLLFF